MIPNVIAAVIQYLKTQTELNAAVASRIYGQSLPRVDSASMPRKCVVIRSMGGPADAGTIELDRVRIDVRCYGQTEAEAFEVYRMVHHPLKYANRTSQGIAFVHNAIRESGPIALQEETVEPDAVWPFVLTAWMVTTGTVPIS